MKYAWIKEHRDSFPVAIMCDVLRVSPSGYYASLERAPSQRAMRHERIKQSVAAVLDGNRRERQTLGVDHDGPPSRDVGSGAAFSSPANIPST